MDVILLHRSTRKLSLTEAGQAFSQVAKKCWQQQKEAKSESMNCEMI